MDPIRYIDRASVASGRLYDLKKKVYLMVLDDSLHPSTEASRIGSRQAHRHLHAAGLNHHSRPDKHTFPASLQFETEGALFEKRILKLRAAFIDVGDE